MFVGQFPDVTYTFRINLGIIMEQVGFGDVRVDQMNEGVEIEGESE